MRLEYRINLEDCPLKMKFLCVESLLSSHYPVGTLAEIIFDAHEGRKMLSVAGMFVYGNKACWESITLDTPLTDYL